MVKYLEKEMSYLRESSGDVTVSHDRAGHVTGD